MCGRYTLFTDIKKIIRMYGLSSSVSFRGTYNASPSQMMPVIAKNRIGLAKWGYVAPKSEIGADVRAQINTRAETVAEKPMFREAFSRRRCLIPANGFYEWAQYGEGQNPWYISPIRDEFVMFAGLWARTEEKGKDPVTTFSILTRPAISFLQDIHSRMPVILTPKSVDTWLHGTGPERLSCLRDAPPVLHKYQVSKKVNNPANDTETLIEPNMIG